MPGNIFISYRRADSAGYAQAVYHKLCERFGRERIFMDVDTIRPGQDFVTVLENAVGSCDAVVALIGRHWLQASDEKGRRLDDPHDFVRLELTTALDRHITVIPVLLDGTPVPREEELPDPLRRLSRRHALELSNTRFSQDVTRLADSLAHVVSDVEDGEEGKGVEGGAVAVPRPHRPRPRRWWRAVAGVVVLVAGSVALRAAMTSDDARPRDPDAGAEADLEPATQAGEFAPILGAEATGAAGPFAVFRAGPCTDPAFANSSCNHVMVGNETVLLRARTCELRNWGRDCTKTLGSVALLTRLGAEHLTLDDAIAEYCGALESVRPIPLAVGELGRLSYDGREYDISNAPPCPP